MGAFTFENTGGGGGPFKMFRGGYEDANKSVPTYTEMTFSDYIVPPAGLYRLKLTGFAEPVEVPIREDFRKPDGPTHKVETKLELEIMSDRGKGKRWLCNYVTFSLGDRANLFKIYVATVCNGDAKKAPTNRVFDHMIGEEFEAYINVSDRRDDAGKPIRAMIAWDTVKAVGSAEDEYDPFTEPDVA